MGDFAAICSDESRICTIEDIKTVVDKVDYSNLDQLKYILKSLGNFARQEENRTVLEQGGAAKIAKESLEKGNNDNDILAFAARLIGNMSYDHGENRLVFLGLGIVPEIVKILSSSKHRELTRNATGTLANLASENSEIQKIIVENGGLQVIAQLLASEYPEVVSLALRALNNTSECVDTQSKIMETNALSNLVDIIRQSEDQDDYVRNTAVEILTTLSSNADVAKALLVDYKLQVVLWKVLQEWLERGSWDTEDEDEEPEEGLEEEKPFPICVTLLLVHLANKDPLVQYFWDSQIAIPILEQATKSVTASDGKTQKAKLEVIRNLGRCFALLSLNDATINELFINLPTIHKLAKSDDPTIRMSALMIFGNMARSDEYCDKLSEHGVVTDIISAIETYPGDQRIAHVGLSALRNLSIPAKHKAQIVESGGLQIAIQQLSTMNQVIQFEAIGILKCLLLDKTVLNDTNVNKFLELGGLPQVVKLATHATTEGLDENEGKDPRVMFESSRLLCRLVSNEEVRKQIGTDVVGPFTTLVTSNFALLQMEGAQALLNLLTKEEYLPAINNELDRIADTLLALDATANTTTILATLLWEIFEFLNKGLVEPPVAAKFNDWKTKSQRITPQ